MLNDRIVWIHCPVRVIAAAADPPMAPELSRCVVAVSLQKMMWRPLSPFYSGYMQ